MLNRARTATRFFVYGCLGFGTLLFGFPLLWMLSTSLSPVEQTLSYPPRLIPLAHYASVEGERREVTIGAEVLAPPGWVLVTERSAGSKSTDKSLRQALVAPESIETKVKPRWDNYEKALAALGGKSLEEIEGFVAPTTRVGADSEVSFYTFFGNTLLVCVLGVIGTLFSNSLVAYGFARLKWRGRDRFFALTLTTLMIPYPVLMVPLFGVFHGLGWIGTLLPLWVPSFFGSAFNIFLMRQFFRTLPIELNEAARIDGASEFRIFWQIILPLSRPVLAVAALFHFLHTWNDFLGPLLYLTRKHTFTLGLALQNYQTTHGGVQWHFLMAASCVTILPVMVLFFFAQKTFIQGIATTGSKS
jgi:multiple sugar transport system permease protein